MEMDRNVSSSSSSDPDGKQGVPAFKIKIPYKKVTGKEHPNTEGTSTVTDANATMTPHSAETVGSQGFVMNAPSRMACMTTVESSLPESMSTIISQTHEEDLKPAEDTRKSEVQRGQVRHGRTRSSSFDAREDAKILNSIPLVEEKHGRFPTINNSQVNEATMEPGTSAHRQTATGTDSKEFRESTASILTSSFLDALNEEERRVRTRHLPAVAGFHRLHKKEINHDLLAVKNMIKSMSSTQPNRTKRVVSDETGVKYGDKMDTGSDEIMAAASDEDNSSDTSGPVLKGSGKTAVIIDDSMDLNISTFSVPYPDSNFVMTELDDLPSQKSNFRQFLLRSPEAVDSLTTFNPPRPPESTGSKKKHRLLRWEKNPQDIEKDLINYRKTVRRTKEELQKTVRERERLETVGSFIRSLFMHHLNGMRLESEYLAKELNQLQTEAHRLIEGDTKMKTRTKGPTAKANSVMRDVMSFLNSHRKWNCSSVKESQTSSLVDCNPMAFPSGFKPPLDWLVRGDRVSTPYGEGVIAQVIGPKVVGNDRTMDVYPTRVCVRLSYGTAYLSPLHVRSLERPVWNTVENLTKRWTMMLESATEFSTWVEDAFHHALVLTGDVNEGSTRADLMTHSTKMLKDSSDAVVLSDGIYTGLLATYPVDSLCRVMENVFDSDRCVLAQDTNSHIPKKFRETDERRRELQELEGQVLQLRNEVSRQRKLRIAAERSLSTNQDRTRRCESLLSEMQSDLISLKERLNDDLVELGVDQERAAELLSDFYRDHYANGSSPSSSRKRKYNGHELGLEGKCDLMESNPTRLDPRFDESLAHDNEDSVDLENDDGGL